MLKEFSAARARYRNTYTHSNPGLRDLLRWVLSRHIPPRPSALALTPNDPAALRANRSEPTLTWIGHSTFLIQIEGVNVLTDPVFTDAGARVYFAGPRRITPVGLPLEELPEIDCVVISHNHHDHLSEPSVRALLKRQAANPPLFVVPAGLGNWFRRRGFPRVAELDWWESLDFKGLTLRATPAQHWSQRIPFLVNYSRWMGLAIEGKGGRLFFPGDTGYSKDFQDIRDRIGPMTIALLPIGAYEPRWFMQPMHTNPGDAVRIHRDLDATLSVAMHWGTFALTDEPFGEPPQRLREEQKNQGVPEKDFWVMGHGETRSLKGIWK